MIVCGIDEAGRGSFVGPMAIAGVAIDDAKLDMLREAGVRDSKVLSPHARGRLHDTILKSCASYVVIRVRPQTIDNSVVFHGLSDLELHRMARIIRSVRADAYYVDSCYADADLFGSRLADMSGSRSVHSYIKADSKYTVVAAASILAKVARDRSISYIRRRHPVGSGYPSDSKTIQYVRDVYLSTGTVLPFVRKSWSTAHRVLGDQRPSSVA